MTPLFNRLLHLLVALAVAIAPAVTSASTVCGGNCCSGEKQCCGGCTHGKTVKSDEKSVPKTASCCAAKKPVAASGAKSCCAHHAVVVNKSELPAESAASAQRCECCRPVAPSPQRSEDRGREVRAEFQVPLFVVAYDQHSFSAGSVAMCGVADGFTAQPAGAALRVWLCSFTC